MPVPDRVFAQMPELSDSALQALLAMVHLGFRFDPEASSWRSPERTFSRAEVQAESSLSAQGTREGLREIERAGHVCVDRSGRRYEYALEIEVPERRYTYLPTALFEVATGLSGTELRLALAILRATWGWTSDSSENGSAPEHRRWARLSRANLQSMTGRSASALKTAAKALSDGLLQRHRPGQGAYYWRLSSLALEKAAAPDRDNSQPTDSQPTKSSDPQEARPTRVRKRTEAFFSMGLPNRLAPDRQQTASPRRRDIEILFRETQHRAREANRSRSKRQNSPPDGDSAVPSSAKPPSSSANRSSKHSETEPGTDLTGFSDRKQDLGQKLANVGVWPRRIPELLRRYSAERIEANFELFRRRTQSEVIQKPGAWLATAIDQGYALPGLASGQEPSGEDQAEDSRRKNSSTQDPGLPAPGTKVTENRKQQLLTANVAEKEDFDRFARPGDPSQRQHFYRVDKTPSPADR